jgi:hypothetical protein
MALYRNRNLEAKKARIKNEWSKIKPKVFKDMAIPRQRLEEFEQQLIGYVVLPGTPIYDQDRQETMLTPYSAKPQLIVYCKAPNDVRLCLELAHEFDIWVTCRSGGHSFAGYSVNTGMVIDLSNMNRAMVDSQNKQARIEPGAQFQLINSILTYPYRLHLPGGTCPDVACAGYMQGGGYGLTSRRFGMHCDSVLEVTMMLYDGSIVVANAQKNDKLFWAVRGGTGNNFGVLLETKYQLYDLADVWGFAFMWEIQTAPAVLRELQANYMRTGKDTKLGSEPVLAMYPDNKTKQLIPKLVVLGLYQGTEKEGTNAMKSILAIGNPQPKFSKIGAYADLNEEIFSVLPGIPTNPPQPMVTRSGYISSPVDIKTWEAICQQFAQTPNQWNILGIEPYGGAISAYPKDGNAFIHRDVDMNLFVFAFLEQGKEKPDQQWLDNMANTLSTVWNGQVYQNYPVRDFPNFRAAYWGDAFNNLLAVKQKYDPDNFFHFEQSISPYPADKTIQRSKVVSKVNNKKIVYESYSKK